MKAMPRRLLLEILQCRLLLCVVVFQHATAYENQTTRTKKVKIKTTLHSAGSKKSSHREVAGRAAAATGFEVLTMSFWCRFVAVGCGCVNLSDWPLVSGGVCNRLRGDSWSNPPDSCSASSCSASSRRCLVISFCFCSKEGYLDTRRGLRAAPGS